MSKNPWGFCQIGDACRCHKNKALCENWKHRKDHNLEDEDTSPGALKQTIQILENRLSDTRRALAESQGRENGMRAALVLKNTEIDQLKMKLSRARAQVSFFRQGAAKPKNPNIIYVKEAAE